MPASWQDGGDGQVTVEESPVMAYVTTASRSRLFSSEELEFSRPASMSPYIVRIDPSTTWQTVDGFGAAITGATSYNLMQMTQEARTAFLKEMFDPRTGIGSSLIRVPIGSSEFPARG